jgi:Domain of unknown function (DUF4406)
MTGIKDLNKPLFNRYARLLRGKGYRVVNPPELDRVDPQRTWEGCLQRDIRFLMDCDRIAVLSGWKRSKGANLEVHIGRALGYSVRPVNYWLKRRK